MVAREVHVHPSAVGDGGQVVIWATGRAVFRDEIVGEDGEEWGYEGEYMFLLDVGDEGKIERIVEFLDSKGTERLRGLVVRAREKLGDGGEAW